MPKIFKKSRGNNSSGNIYCKKISIISPCQFATVNSPKAG